MMNITSFTGRALIIFIALTFIGCKKDRQVDEFEEIQGDFVVNLVNQKTKAFWDGLSTGEACEKELKNAVMFIYETGQDGYVFHKIFSDKELGKADENPHVVVSMSEGALDKTKTYDFYVLANHNLTEQEIAVMTRTQLLALQYNDIESYNATNFSDIYTASGAVSKRGLGFAMSGESLGIAPSADKNVPRKVNIIVARNVAKLEVKSYTTADFETNYAAKFGSKLIVKSVTLYNIPKISGSIANKTHISLDANYVNYMQYPKQENGNPTTAANSDPYSYNNIFFLFQNGLVAGDVVVDKKPKVKVVAEFDFDGEANSVPTDVSTIEYDIDIEGVEATKKGLITRNSYLKLEIKISGLTSNEVVANFKISDWNAVVEQTITVGS